MITAFLFQWELQIHLPRVIHLFTDFWMIWLRGASPLPISNLKAAAGEKNPYMPTEEDIFEGGGVCLVLCYTLSMGVTCNMVSNVNLAFKHAWVISHNICYILVSTFTNFANKIDSCVYITLVNNYKAMAR